MLTISQRGPALRRHQSRLPTSYWVQMFLPWHNWRARRCHKYLFLRAGVRGESFQCSLPLHIGVGWLRPFLWHMSGPRFWFPLI